MTFLLQISFMLFLEMACSVKKSPPEQGEAPLNFLEGNSSAKLHQADADLAQAHWLNRHQKESLLESLAIYEQIYPYQKDDKELLARLSRGWYLYGDVFEQEDVIQRSFWQKSFGYAENCLALNPEYQNTDIQSLRVEDIECAYWYAVALGKKSQKMNVATILHNQEIALTYITEISNLQPDFFYDAPARYLGVYYATIPSFAGQDFEKSAQYFTASVSHSPQYLWTLVLQAQTLDVALQDATAFTAHLQQVVNSNPSEWPEELRPENHLAQEKAHNLLEHKAQFFFKSHQ